MYFEQGKFEECFEECEKAVTKGREQRADYKLIARYCKKLCSLAEYNNLCSLHLQVKKKAGGLFTANDCSEAVSSI